MGYHIVAKLPAGKEGIWNGTSSSTIKVVPKNTFFNHLWITNIKPAKHISNISVSIVEKVTRKTYHDQSISLRSRLDES
jgi:hypothetical protein